jgi:hypothetical protein
MEYAEKEPNIRTKNVVIVEMTVLLKKARGKCSISGGTYPVRLRTSFPASKR